jgi:hypothetical protein
MLRASDSQRRARGGELGIRKSDTAVSRLQCPAISGADAEAEAEAEGGLQECLVLEHLFLVQASSRSSSVEDARVCWNDARQCSWCRESHPRKWVAVQRGGGSVAGSCDWHCDWSGQLD